MCNCRKMTDARLVEMLGKEGQIIDFELLSERTFSTFQYKDGKKSKSQLILHSYCPFCGQKYKKQVEG